MIATLPKMLVQYATLKEFGSGHNNLVIFESIQIPALLTLDADDFAIPNVITTELPEGTIIVGPDSLPQALGASLSVEFAHKFDAKIMSGAIIKKSSGDDQLILRTRNPIQASIHTHIALKLKRLIQRLHLDIASSKTDAIKAGQCIIDFVMRNYQADVINAANDLGYELDLNAICNNAALHGNIGFLQHAHTHGYEFTTKQTQNAIWAGSVECLQYIHEAGADLDPTACEVAATYGYLDCLIYAHTNGASWDASMCAIAAAKGHIDCLRFMYANGCAWDKRTCESAAANGQLLCLRYAHENNCAWDDETCKLAAKNGHLHCLRYAHEAGCAWNHDACNMAMLCKHLDCFKYLVDNGCKIYSECYYYAALGGSLACLQYLHENDSKITVGFLRKHRKTHSAMWNEGVARLAAGYGYLDCLEYMHVNGCPWDKRACEAARDKGQDECVKYLHQNVCECDCEKG